MAKPSTKQLVEAVGISRSYAHEILNEDREPSATLAAQIFLTTGFKTALFKSLSDTDAQIVARAHRERQ